MLPFMFNSFGFTLAMLLSGVFLKGCLSDSVVMSEWAKLKQDS